MILDGLIVRLGSANKSIPTNTVIEMEDLIKLIKKKNGKTSKPSKLTNNLNVKYFHPKIALNYNLVILSEQLCETGTNIDWLNILSNQKFCSENHYFLRGVLLCEKNCVDSSTWLMILACLAAIVKENIDVSTDMIYFVLFLLAKEIDGEKQLALLRALNHFASVKVNISINFFFPTRNYLCILFLLIFLGKYSTNFKHLSCFIFKPFDLPKNIIN